MSLNNKNVVQRLIRCQYCIVLVLLMSLVLISCGKSQSPQNQTIPQGTYSVEPIFREYYSDLGGMELLGPAISTGFTQGNLECQYTEAVLMCQDPLLTGAGRYQLYPLGLNMGIQDNPDEMGVSNGQLIIDGYILYPEFVAAYEALRGAQNSGHLISSARYNYELQRVEQYFENAGFYSKFDEPSGKVHLLPYGAAYCGEKCVFQVDADEQLEPDKKIRTPYAAILESWGGMRVFGRPLTDPYTASDGSVEQVYENVVLYSSNGQLETVGLRPLAKILGMTTTPPGPKLYDRERQVVFYNLSGETGYHVPILFDEFILAHGGMAVSGNPIADIMYYDDNKLPRQCFENYCLDLYGDAAPSLKVRLAPLGLRYLDQVKPVSNPEKYLPPTGLALNIEEKAPQVPSGEIQSIEITVFIEESHQPQANIPARLELTLPDGAEYGYDFPVTSIEGKARLDLPALVNMPGGSLINYRVCLDIQSDNPICEYDAYLIWNP
jgi:hypothetical protein